MIFMVSSRESLIGIDIVRFACAISVMSFHYCTTAWLGPSQEAARLLADASRPDPGLVAAARFNWIGVQIFFTISGCVIARSMVSSRGLSFLRKRLLRLLPAAWICSTATLITLAAAGTDQGDLLLRWARSLVLWPLGRQIDPSYWTLSIELCFYLVVAVLVGGTASRGIESVANTLLLWSLSLIHI